MAKRGRPRMNGLQPAWMLERAVIVVHTFNEARARGEKYEAAIQEAIDAVKKRNMPIGPRRVKQILAEWQPEGSPEVFVISRASETEMQTPKMKQSMAILRDIQKNGVPTDNAGILADRNRVLAEKNGSAAATAELASDDKVAVFSIKVGPRPEYLRHNARAGQD
jgi:hypothetical protein